MVVSLEFKMQTRLLAKEIGEALKGASADAIKLFCNNVVDHAKQNVPVKSGTLRDSIKASVRKARKEDRIIAKVSTNTKGMAKYAKGREAVKTGQLKKSQLPQEARITYGYGLDVEIGRASIGKKYKSTPYLRPALKEATPDLPKIMQQAAQFAAIKQARQRKKKP